MTTSFFDGFEKAASMDKEAITLFNILPAVFNRGLRRTREGGTRLKGGFKNWQNKIHSPKAKIRNAIGIGTVGVGAAGYGGWRLTEKTIGPGGELKGDW